MTRLFCFVSICFFFELQQVNLVQFFSEGGGTHKWGGISWFRANLVSWEVNAESPLYWGKLLFIISWNQPHWVGGGQTNYTISNDNMSQLMIMMKSVLMEVEFG